MPSEVITKVFSEALERAIPGPPLTVSKWADTYRYLSQVRSARASAIGGPLLWSTDLVPFTRDIMDAASDPEVHEIIFVKPNQIAATESICNMIGYFAHHDPSTQLYACEDEKKADAWSKEALAPMIRDTPVLRALVRESRMRDSDNTIKAKRYPGGHLAIGWSTSPATASSRPRRIVYLDERDAYKPTSEGDYCELAKLRTDTFENKLIVKASTPRDRLENPPGTPLDAPRYSPIEREYQDSDRRKFFVPCLHCETFQTLNWSNVKWDDEPLLAYYVCVHCGAVLEEEDKAEMLAAGEWRAEAEFRGRAGFFLNKLYSPFVTWGEVAEAFVIANRSGDPNQLRVWVNTALAEGWQPREDKIQTTELESRREDYGGDGVLPVGICLLVCGVDLQPDRLELEIVGFGLNYESWSAEYVVIDGDPAAAAVWQRLKAAVLMREFTRADGVKLKVSCTTVDSGDGGFTNEVYKFAYENRGYRVFAIKGSSTPGRPLVGKPSIAGRPPVKLFVLGTEAAKDTFTANLRLADHGPGYCHFPLERKAEMTTSGDAGMGRASYDSDYFKQLLSERPRIKKGVRVWEKIREAARNEALDCRVYAMAAYAILNPNMTKLHERLLGQAAALELKEGEPAPDEPAGGDRGGAPSSPPAPSAQRSERSGFRVPRRRDHIRNY